MRAAEALARRLGAKRSGSCWLAPCPAHDDRTPSLSIRDGDRGPLLHCFAGCSSADVVAALKARGLWEAGERRDEVPWQPPEPRQQPKETDRVRLALRLWREAQPVEGSPVKTYLRSRGLDLYGTAALRYHPACPRGSGERLPAMLGLLTDAVTGEPCGVHRTFLALGGAGKAEGAAKMMLGRSAGAVIRLSPDDEVTLGLGISEGVETGLSVIARGWRPVWAAGSAGGIRRLPPLPGIEALTIFSDLDSGGVGLAAARACAAAWAAAGKEVEILPPTRRAAA